MFIKDLEFLALLVSWKMAISFAVSVRHSVVPYGSCWTEFCEILHEVGRGILMSAETMLLTYRHFAALNPNINSVAKCTVTSILISLIQHRLKMSENRLLTKTFGPKS